MKNITVDGVEYTPVIKEDYKRLTQTLDFEIYHKDLGKMSWDDAKKACAELGKGWRLPTRIELILMFETQPCDFNAMGYWSSSEFDNGSAWIHNFDNGYQYYNDKCKPKYVHPVRDVRTFSLTSGTSSTGILNTQSLTSGKCSAAFLNKTDYSI